MSEALEKAMLVIWGEVRTGDEVIGRGRRRMATQLWNECVKAAKAEMPPRADPTMVHAQGWNQYHDRAQAKLDSLKVQP